MNFSLRNALLPKFLVKIAELYHLAMLKEGHKTKVPLLEEGDLEGFYLLCYSTTTYDIAKSRRASLSDVFLSVDSFLRPIIRAH